MDQLKMRSNRTITSQILAAFSRKGIEICQSFVFDPFSPMMARELLNCYFFSILIKNFFLKKKYCNWEGIFHQQPHFFDQSA